MRRLIESECMHEQLETVGSIERSSKMMHWNVHTSRRDEWMASLVVSGPLPTSKWPSQAEGKSSANEVWAPVDTITTTFIIPIFHVLLVVVRLQTHRWKHAQLYLRTFEYTVDVAPIFSLIHYLITHFGSVILSVLSSKYSSFYWQGNKIELSDHSVIAGTLSSVPIQKRRKMNIFIDAISIQSWI